MFEKAYTNIFIIVFCITLTGCALNKKPSNYPSSISLFSEACLNEFTASRNIMPTIKKYRLKPLSDKLKSQYTEDKKSLAYSYNDYVIVNDLTTCTVFDKKHENSIDHAKFMEKTLKPGVKKLKNSNNSIKFRSNSDFIENSISYYVKSNKRKISLYSSNINSSFLLNKFTKRYSDKLESGKSSSYNNESEIVRSILTIDLQPNKVFLTNISNSLDCLILIKLFGTCSESKKISIWNLPDDFDTLSINKEPRIKTYWNKSNRNIVSTIIKKISLNENRILAITKSKPINNKQICIECTPLISAITLEKEGDNWEATNINKFITFLEGRRDVKGTAIKLISNSGFFVINNHTMEQKNEIILSSIIYPNSGSFDVVWNGITGQSNIGSCGTHSAYGPAIKCYKYKYDLSFSQEKTNGLPDMQMKAILDGNPQGSNYKGPLPTYKFNGSVYTLIMTTI